MDAALSHSLNATRSRRFRAAIVRSSIHAAAVRAIPDGAPVVFIFGEIDCREGLLVAVERTRYESLDAGVAHTVSIYIGVLKALAKARRFTILVQYGEASPSASHAHDTGCRAHRTAVRARRTAVLARRAALRTHRTAALTAARALARSLVRAVRSRPCSTKRVTS
jgi:hypothetical protein